MKIEINWMGKIRPFLNLHWFKIGVGVLALYLFLSKDLSFNISLQAPVRQEVAPPGKTAPASKSTRRETLTDNAPRTASLTNHLDFFSGFGRSAEFNLLQGLKQREEADIQSFIRRFAHVAEDEQDRYGVPASIILANGLLHSQAGQRDAVSRASNYFGLSCSRDWQGATLEEGSVCLRQYDNAWLSFRDHSLYLTTGPNAHLKRLGTNYEAWAKAMEDVGYANEPNLAEQLIQTIERYELFQYDE